MLADQLDYIVGVDPHRDSHALAVVQIVSGTVVFETTIDANSDGYAHALQLVDEHAPGRRAFAIERDGPVWARAHPLSDRPRAAGARGRPAAQGAPLGR